MSDVAQWFAMGGYASYVWPAYSLVAFTLVIMMVGVKNQRKHMHKKLERWFK